MQRTAVVTGGAGGIGSAIVRVLSGSGHDVAILDRECRTTPGVVVG